MSDGHTILLVDDYRDALDVWEIYLSAFGYTVLTAASGPDALALVADAHPSLVVTDLELPGMSGFEIARRLRANPATEGIPLIAATGYSHMADSQRARESGFDRVIVKPCAPDALLAEIRRLLKESPQSDHA
jgi:CheY-like chemotaxis protein